MLRIYIGYDEREKLAAQVCKRSILQHSSIAADIRFLRLEHLQRAGLYWRKSTLIDGQRYDVKDKRPFSTDFSFSRFLVPALCQWEGVAVFCDSDFMFRDDIAKLAAFDDRTLAVRVVRHIHKPDETVKMRGQVQAKYDRKNWSSLILWNCAHPANKALTPIDVNERSGRWLHQFGWLSDDQIGGLPARWNWLEGYSEPDREPAAVHYTRGTPDMPGYEDSAYADEWRRIADGMGRRDHGRRSRARSAKDGPAAGSVSGCEGPDPKARSVEV